MGDFVGAVCFLMDVLGVEEDAAAAIELFAGHADKAEEVAVVHEVEAAFFHFVLGGVDPLGHAAHAGFEGEADAVFGVFPVDAAQAGDVHTVLVFPEAQGGIGDVHGRGDFGEAEASGAEFDEFLADVWRMHFKLRVEN